MDPTEEREKFMKLKNTLLAIAAAVLVGCAPVQPSSQQQESSQNSILKIGDPQFTAGIDPAKDWEGWFTIRFGIGETLFRLTNDFNVEPWLASSYKKIDNQTWEIHLKENITFSNGNPVNSDAVIASLQRLGEKHQSGEIFKTATYTANDSLTFTVHTEKPSPQFIHELVDSKTAIVDVTSTDKIIGTGPYEVKEFKPNDSISLTASAHYWDGNASIKEVHYQLIPDQKTLELAIKSKEVDGGVDLNDDVADSLKNDSSVQVYNQPSSRTYHLELNKARLQDKKVRQAILYAINKQELTQDFLKGHVTPADGAFLDSSIYSSGTFANKQYQPEMTTKLLEEAGYKTKNADGILVNAQNEPLQIVLKTYKRLANEKIATALQQQLKKVGIDLKIDIQENVDGFNQLDYDIALASSLTLPTGDPYYFLNASLSSQGALNYVKNSDQWLDEKISALAHEEDSEKIRSEVAKIQDYAKEEAIAYYIGFINLNAAMNDYVHHFELHSSDIYQITNQLVKD